MDVRGIEIRQALVPPLRQEIREFLPLDFVPRDSRELIGPFERRRLLEDVGEVPLVCRGRPMGFAAASTLVLAFDGAGVSAGAGA